jgi:deazaflavin-dependent oxidoreductase (nitroreductase family)
MKMPGFVRYFNKHLLNKLTIHIARSARGPFAIIIHVGWRSGKTYETPIIVQRAGDGFVLALTYGWDVDWVKNVMAAGRCTIILHRQVYSLHKIEPLDRAAALPAFPWLERLVLRLIGIDGFLKMDE